jgi:hypothetical protein
VGGGVVPMMTVFCCIGWWMPGMLRPFPLYFRPYLIVFVYPFIPLPVIPLPVCPAPVPVTGETVWDGRQLRHFPSVYVRFHR